MDERAQDGSFRGPHDEHRSDLGSRERSEHGLRTMVFAEEETVGRVPWKRNPGRWARSGPWSRGVELGIQEPGRSSAVPAQIWAQLALLVRETRSGSEGEVRMARELGSPCVNLLPHRYGMDCRGTDPISRIASPSSG